MQISLVVNKTKNAPDKIVSNIITLLDKYSIKHFEIDEDLTKENIFNQIKEKISDSNLIISIGGDGTLLTSLKLAYPLSIPVLPIYNGTLGFIAEILPDEGIKILEDYILENNNTYEIESRPLLSINVNIDNKSSHYYAINEIVIGKTDWRLAGLHININNDEIAYIKADGLVIATPTGSTAYSLSAGGSIVSPTVKAILLSPVAAHSLTFRPLVIPENDNVKVYLDKKTTEAMIAIDGYLVGMLKANDYIEATIDHKTFSILVSKSRTFYNTLRDKLNWGK